MQSAVGSDQILEVEKYVKMSSLYILKGYSFEEEKGASSGAFLDTLALSDAVVYHFLSFFIQALCF